MKTAIKTVTSRFPAALKAGIYGVIYPLARICVQMGINVHDVQAITKKAFVDAAGRKLRADGERVSVSRVALVSGLTRLETSGLVASQLKGLEPRPGAVARVIEAWTTEARWTDEGNPRTLPVKGPLSFEALCSSCRVTTYTARTLLEHMESSGIVEVDLEERISLKRLVNIPPDLLDQAICGLQNIGRHAATVEHNLVGDGRKLFEQVAGSLKVPPGQRSRAKRMYRAAARELAEALGRRIRNFESDTGAQFEDIGVGVFMYQETDNEE